MRWTFRAGLAWEGAPTRLIRRARRRGSEEPPGEPIAPSRSARQGTAGCASLISFDDLLGYPVPNAAQDGLEYLRTPGDLWGAASLFLDEPSRGRPESQNKLFSVIHERRVQGLPLPHLRYR